MTPTKYMIFAAAAAALLAAPFVVAQTRTAEDGEALQRELERKAVRIPLREAVQARAAEAAQDRRARLVARGPNLAALREDLRRTRTEDDARETTAAQESLADAPQLSAPPAPPPGLRALAADRLARVDEEEVDRVLLPVLIPAHPDVRDKIKIYGMRNVYTATAEIDAEAAFSMTGTCNRVIGGDPEVAAFRKRLAESPPRLPGTGAEYHISRNDFGVDLSFSKFGCGYVMTIECGNPREDARCAADDYIIGLAQSLILANPELAEGE